MYWYEVFDDEQVQLRVRRRAAHQVMGLLAALSAFGCGGVILAELWGSWLTALGFAGLLALVAVVGTAASLARLRGIVWCVKLTSDHVVGYDYARRRVALDWDEVEMVDLAGRALRIVGRPTGPHVPSLLVPDSFAAFAALSHRVIRHAEDHAVPVCVDGRPWQLLDVGALYPFLQPCLAPADAPSGENR